MILPILANIIVPRIAASVFLLDYITLMLVITNGNQIEQNIQKTISNQENVHSNNDIISDDFFANK